MVYAQVFDGLQLRLLNEREAATCCLIPAAERAAHQGGSIDRPANLTILSRCRFILIQ